MEDLPIFAYLQDIFPDPGDAAIVEFERLARVRLPTAYKNFLHKFNGGTFHGGNGIDVCCTVARPTGYVTGAEVRYFFGFNTGADYSDLFTNWNGSEDFAPKGYIPIADVWSDDVMLATRGRSRGSVYLLDGVERWTSKKGENLHLIANSFDGFLRNLAVEFDDSYVRGKSELLASIWRGDGPAVERYLREGGSPNAADDEGISLLMFATELYRLPIVQMLIRAGANVNASTPDARTPLYYAARGGSFDGARLLLENGAVYSPSSAEGQKTISAIREDNHRFRELLQGFQP